MGTVDTTLSDTVYTKISGPTRSGVRVENISSNSSNVYLIESATLPAATDVGTLLTFAAPFERRLLLDNLYALSLVDAGEVRVGRTSATQTVSKTGTGSSGSIAVKPGNPFNVGFGVAVSGTVDYTIQHTFDGTSWFNHEFVAAVTDAQDGNYAYPVAAIRVTVNSGTGTATLTAIQAE